MIFLRFFVGFSLAGCMLTQFVYIVETVGPNKRTHAGKAHGSFWKFGAWGVVLLAYFVRDWRFHVLFGSLTGIVFFFFIWYVLVMCMENLFSDRKGGEKVIWQRALVCHINLLKSMQKLP